MSGTKQITGSDQLIYRTAYACGWADCESHIEQRIMERDPTFLAWLDKLDRLARVQRERDELVLQQQQQAAQAADDDLHSH